jgi:hypothetical protein
MDLQLARPVRRPPELVDLVRTDRTRRSIP